MVNLIPFIHLDSGWEKYSSACMKEPGGSQPPSLSSPHTALGSMLIILDAQPLGVSQGRCRVFSNRPASQPAIA
jgi:hypothetical protein